MRRILIVLLFLGGSYAKAKDIPVSADSVSILLEKGNALKAKEAYTKLSADGHTINSKTLWIGVQVALANAEWKTARELLEKIKIEETKTASGGDTLKQLFYTGKIEFFEGRYAKARKAYWSVFTTLRNSGREKDPLYEEALYCLGEFFYETGNFPIAEKIYASDLSSAADIYGKDDFRYARAMDKIGEITSLKSEFDNAVTYHETAEKILVKAFGKNHPETARNMVFRGKLYLEKGEYTVSEAYFRQAAKIYKEFLPKIHPYQLELDAAYADLYIYLHNYGTAVDLMHSNIATYEKYYNTSHPAITSSSYKIAAIYLENGYVEQSKPYLDTATLISNSKMSWKHPDHLYTRSIMAEYLLAKGDTMQADSLYSLLTDSVQHVLNDKNRLITGLTSGHARMYYKTGKYEEAISLYQRIKEMQKEILEERHPEYIQSVRDQALIYWAMRKTSKSGKYFKYTADNYVYQFNKVFAFQSEKEKNLYYKNVKSFFDKYNAFIISNPSPKYIGAMYDYQLATKAILFTSTSDLRKKVLESEDNQLQTKYSRWILNKEKLAKLYKLQAEGYAIRQRTIDSMETLTNSLEKDIQLAVELKHTKSGLEKQLLTWKDIHAKLGPNDATIEIIRVQDFRPDSGGVNTSKVYYAALVITKETKKAPQMILLSEGKDLEKRYVQYYRNSIHFQLEDTVSYNHFWKPIAEASVMKGKNKIYLSVDGVYNQININTFYHASTEKFVVQELDIQLVTNTKDVVAIKNKTTELTKVPENTILFGFPDYYHQPLMYAKKSSNKKQTNTKDLSRDSRSMFRGGNIHELPGTKEEVNAINRIFIANGNKVTTLRIGKDAAEDSLKAIENPGILHIASHGFFLEPQKKKQSNENKDEVEVLNELNDNPLLLCGIMLSGAGHAYSEEVLDAEIKALYKGESMEDGILTAYEAMNMDLHSLELVVLSCCETGLGEVKNGEGVYGFQRALQTAGAKSIIMSLWKVNDGATQKLMTYFYEEWIKSSNKRASFAKAQEKLRLEYKTPIFWGAFIMIGE
jgi:CHAT domain-containing protein